MNLNLNLVLAELRPIKIIDSRFRVRPILKLNETNASAGAIVRLLELTRLKITIVLKQSSDSSLVKVKWQIGGFDSGVEFFLLLITQGHNLIVDCAPIHFRQASVCLLFGREIKVAVAQGVGTIF